MKCKYKSLFNLFVIASSITTIFYKAILLDDTWEIPAVFIYLLVVGVCLVNTDFNMRRNSHLYDSIAIATFGILFGVIIWEYSVVGICVYMLIISAVYKIWKYTKNIETINDSLDTSAWEDELFPEHKQDLQRIWQYLEQPNIFILGIEACWGNGKTFIMNVLKGQLQRKRLGNKKCEIIEIDILATNVDNFYVFLINGIDEVLRNNGIISRYSHSLRQIVSKDKHMDLLYSLIGNTEFSYASAFTGLKKELQKTGKVVVIVYEDIDRIEDPSLIKKIFYISEKLCCGDIRIIYEYNSVKLQAMGMDHFYLDKYIPHIVQLTEISFRKLCKYVMKDPSMKIDPNILNEKDLYFLSADSFLKSSKLPVRANVLQNLWEDLFRNRFDVREMQHFLQSIAVYSDYYMKDNDRIIRKLVIAFFFIKMFMPEILELIEKERDVIDALRIPFDGSEWDMVSLSKEFRNCVEKSESQQSFDPESRKRKYQEIVHLLFDEQNRLNFMKGIAFYLLGLENAIPLIEDQYKSRNENIFERFENEYSMNRMEFRNEEQLEYIKIQRVIRHLLQAGNAKDTNYKLYADELAEKLKNTAPEQWHDVYSGLFEELYHEEKLYKTIFKIGDQSWHDVFKAYDIAAETWDRHTCVQNYKNIVLLYFEWWKKYKGNEFDFDCIDNLNILMDSIYAYQLREILSLVVSQIVDLKLIGNLSKERSFWLFYARTIRAIASFGYGNEMPNFRTEDLVEGTLMEDGSPIALISALCRKGLNENKQFFEGLEECPEKGKLLVKECQMYLCFLDKMAECSTMKNIVQKQKWPDVRVQSSVVEDPEIEKLKTMTGEELNKVLPTMNLSPDLLRRIIEQRRGKK